MGTSVQQQHHQQAVANQTLRVMDFVMIPITMQSVTMMTEIAAHLIHLLKAGMAFVLIVNVNNLLQLKSHVRMKDLLSFARRTKRNVRKQRFLSNVRRLATNVDLSPVKIQDPKNNVAK